MLAELLATLVIGLRNPADFTGKTMYPSGIHDCDKDFINLAPSEYPVLKTSVPIIDKNGKVINPGIYQAVLRNKEILVVESGHVIGILPVIVTKGLSQKCLLPEANEHILDPDYVQITLKQNESESQSIVRIIRDQDR